MDGDPETRDGTILADISMRRAKANNRRDTLDLLREWWNEEPARRNLSDRDLTDLLNKLHP